MSIPRILKTIAVLLAISFAAAGNAWADHGHSRGRIYLGIGVGPYWGPGWYYPPPTYYYPPTVTFSFPPVYVEQSPSAAPATNYWYYCDASRRYYPYVTSCPGGWRQVEPMPPDVR